MNRVIIIFCTTFIVFFAGISQTIFADTTEVPSIILKHISLDMDINYSVEELSATAILDIKNIGDKPVQNIPLQLGRLMQIKNVTDAQGNPLEYKNDIVLFEDWQKIQVNQMYVSLTSPLNENQTVSISIQYEGTLVGYTESGMLYVRDKIDESFTIIRDDALAFPRISLPSIQKLRAFRRDNFMFNAKITVPKDLTVATGCKEKEIISNDSSNSWVFESVEPVPFLNITIAPYNLSQVDEISIYSFPDDSIGASVVSHAIENANKKYKQWFGNLPSTSQLNIIEIPTGFGSQASLTGGIIQTADAFHDNKQLVQLYHELSHLWQPPELDIPACRWNEGLAMFLQQRMASILDSAMSVDEYIGNRYKNLSQMINDDPRLSEIPMIDYGKNNMTDYSYHIGMYMFYFLYKVMGDESFDKHLHNYFQSYQKQGATNQQFVTLMTKNSPPNVKTIFNDWLLTTNWTNKISSTDSVADILNEYRH